MLLAVDIGNTNIVIALFSSSEIIHEWRIFSDVRRTGDEYSSILLSLFRDKEIKLSDIETSVLSSVVPVLIGPFVGMIEKLFGKKPILVNPNIYDFLPIKVPSSARHEIGTDLVCNSVAAYNMIKKACIVVDFGTALTFTAISNEGCIEGVAITPGIGTAIKSLFNNTAQVPSVPLEAPPSSLGLNTIHAVQSGIVLGYKGLVESLTDNIKNDLSKKTGCRVSEIDVIATGGLNSVLKPITSVFKIVDKQLTLKGLIQIANIVKEKSQTI